MTTGSHTFGIAIPENWTEYDLHGDTLAERRAEMLRHAPQKETRDAINHTFRSARRIMEGARRRGAVYAAGTTAMYEDGLLMAGLMVFSVKPPPGEDFSAKGIAEQFSATGAAAARTPPGPSRRRRCPVSVRSAGWPASRRRKSPTVSRTRWW